MLEAMSNHWNELGKPAFDSFLQKCRQRNGLSLIWKLLSQDCMSSQEVVDFVHKHLETEHRLSNVCEKLLSRCVTPTSGGEGCGNMTVIVVLFKKLAPVVATSSTE